MKNHTRGFSMIGLLITMVCILVLFVIGMNALNKAVTGQGSAVRGTVRSTQDMILLNGLYTSMIVAGQNMPDSRLPVPSMIAHSDDWSLNTTANLYSAMIAQNYIQPGMVISANEYSPYVEEKVGYDYTRYSPISGVYWDDSFQANLDHRSHTSFAHMPLFGERFSRGWQANFAPDVALLGNRGPKDGVDDPQSYSYGRSGTWGGHVVFGDGSITFLNEFTPPNAVMQGDDGSSRPDNIFAMEQGPAGRDAILSFTSAMTPQGPELQHD